MIKCRNKSCDNEFQQWSTLQRLCPTCMIEKGRKIEAKTERKQHKEAKERLKSRGDHLAAAQKAFNRYIRARDYNKPCISCDDVRENTHFRASKWDCGHYRSVGANPELRFEELNTAKQCVYCNRDLSGNVVNFRIKLKERIGEEKLDWLEGPHEPKKYTIEEIKAIKAKYSKKARELEAIIKA